MKVVAPRTSGKTVCKAVAVDRDYPTSCSLACPSGGGLQVEVLQLRGTTQAHTGADDLHVRFGVRPVAFESPELLSRYLDLSRKVIVRYGGTVEKFIGDAVITVWGVPTAHEDDAERAVRAALELVDTVKGLGPMILARAGVLTGEAAVTIGADAIWRVRSRLPRPGC
jgi:hypothetical protein